MDKIISYETSCSTNYQKMQTKFPHHKSITATNVADDPHFLMQDSECVTHCGLTLGVATC